MTACHLEQREGNIIPPGIIVPATHRKYLWHSRIAVQVFSFLFIKLIFASRFTFHRRNIIWERFYRANINKISKENFTISNSAYSVYFDRNLAKDDKSLLIFIHQILFCFVPFATNHRHHQKTCISTVLTSNTKAYNNNNIWEHFFSK